jgi:hypothetical protein
MDWISVDLNCADYELRSVSMGHGRGGAIFSCLIAPVPDEVLAALDQAARSAGTVRLFFPERPLLLERIEVNRIEAGSVRISGRVMKPAV